MESELNYVLVLIAPWVVVVIVYLLYRRRRRAQASRSKGENG